MVNLPELHPYTLKEEIANAASHGIGLLLSFVCVPLLITWTSLQGSRAEVIGVCIFGASIMLVYGVSTLYHSLTNTFTKRIFRILDHISIYYLIAGSYTPFLFIYHDFDPGRWMLIGVWAIVLGGTIFKIFFTGRYPIISLASYLGMGWIIVFFGWDILAEMSPASLGWLVAGGLSYTLGVVFYRWESMHYHHAIWHIFVLGGTAAHYIAVLLSVGRNLPDISNFMR